MTVGDVDVFYRESGPHLLDAGHFAIETYAEEIGQLMLKFLGKQIG
jgi:hypothetical protein